MRTACQAWIACMVLSFVGGTVTAQEPTAPPEDYKAKALKLNKQTNTEDSANAKIRELMKDKPGTAKLVKAAAEVQRGAKENEKPFRFYAALVLAMAAEGVKNYDAADLFFGFATENAINDLQSGKMITLAAERQLDFLMGRKKYESVIQLTDKLIAIEGDNTLGDAKFFFMEKQIQALSRSGETDKALDKADRLIKLFEGEWYFLQIRAWVQRDSGKLDDAIKTYLDVITAIEGAEKLKKDARTRYSRNTKYLLSGIYLDNNQFDKSAGLLEELIKADPENPSFYNDLGFLWADRDMNLPKAE
ncbi:MAG: tetratricopeptide repeat protein, partial [Gemmataceae bacterium]